MGGFSQGSYYSLRDFYDSIILTFFTKQSYGCFILTISFAEYDLIFSFGLIRISGSTLDCQTLSIFLCVLFCCPVKNFSGDYFKEPQSKLVLSGAF